MASRNTQLQNILKKSKAYSFTKSCITNPKKLMKQILRERHNEG